MPGVLYLIPTPIGNLGDFSPRARELLSRVDFIAAEDTRVTRKLLTHFEVKRPLVSYHQHNTAQSGARILDRVEGGESCALVTDAGTPAISDPGEELVRLAAVRGISVVSVPGPCALVTALAASGLPTGRFAFEGFLSVNRAGREEHLERLKDETRTMIFYEAPHKLKRTLEDMERIFGGTRRIVLCRELSKLHEEIIRATLSEAVFYYAEQAPRGEFVLVVEGAAEKETGAEDAGRMESALSRVAALCGEEGLRPSDAIRAAAREFCVPRNALYEAHLETKRSRG